MIPIERTHEYRGRYHVLGGALSPIDGVEPEDLKLAQLYDRVTNGVSEVILATNPTTTGEATALHVAAALHERAPDVTVTRLASGLPVGGDLEYADEVTLGRAFTGRRARSERRQQRLDGGRIRRLAVCRGIDVALGSRSSLATTPSARWARSARPGSVATPSPAATSSCMTTMSSDVKPIRGSNPSLGAQRQQVAAAALATGDPGGVAQ